MFVFSIVVLLTFSFQVNYINGAILKETIFNYFEDQLQQRTIRQTAKPDCIPPIIPNGGYTISRNKTTARQKILHLRISCNLNYILEYPEENIITCKNGVWLEDIPQCIPCIQRYKITDLESDDDEMESHLIPTCPESLRENAVIKDCGQRIENQYQPFVVNGRPSKYAEFPWHVAIYKKDQNDSEPVYQCGGSIISIRSILTAAHCFSDHYGTVMILRDYYVAAGKYNKNFQSDYVTAQIRKVVRKDLHPHYKGILSNYAWDIAVAIVDEYFDITNLVHAVCIDWMNHFEDEQLSPDNFGEITGWGKTEKYLNSSISILRVLKVPFINREQCQKQVPETFRTYVTSDKFCAGYMNGSSVCGGDSGGGLVFEKQVRGKGKYYIRGLVSVGIEKMTGECDNYELSTYTRISKFVSFIRESIENKSITITPSSESYSTINLRDNTENSTEVIVNCTTPNKEQAKCISIFDCEEFVSALEANSEQEVIQFIKESDCGTEEERKVCCGSTVYYLSRIYSNPVTTQRIKHKNLNLLPVPGAGICGRATQVDQDNQKDFKEMNTVQNHFPWIVSLEDVEDLPVGTGFLINERYVISVAVLHRIIHRVGFGTYTNNDPCREIDCDDATQSIVLPNKKYCHNSSEYVEVEETFIPMFTYRAFINNIALIRLARKITYTDCIKPICLPQNKEKSLPGRQISIVIDSFKRSTHKKMDLSISIKNNKICENENVNNFDMCLYAKEQDIDCFFTDGDLIMSKLTNSNDVYAEGIITSGSISCYNAVATKVVPYIKWILDVIKP